MEPDLPRRLQESSTRIMKKKALDACGILAELKGLLGRSTSLFLRLLALLLTRIRTFLGKLKKGS
tara:strand:- start:45756 stop:45950 length:195 start_codon:yes stop_codon:yes gene_type:complete